MALTNEEKELLKQARLLIERELTAGETVAIYKMGEFSPDKKAARVTRNPRTGEPVPLGERTLVKFKMSESLRKLLV